MSTSKYFDRFAVAIMVMGLLLTILFVNGESLGIQKIVDEDTEQHETVSLFTTNDLNGDWDASNPTATVTLDGNSASIRGNGVYFNDGSVVITGAGRYVFNGTLTDGKIVVDAYDSSKVFLLLNGVTISCSDDACLRVEQADKVFLTLAAGTQNRMESGVSYSQTALDDKTGGVIFSHDDLTINGGGSLDLVANYKHGIDANDDLVLSGGTIHVTAPSDGLHVNDSFRMTKTNLTVTAGDDAVHSDTDIYIESGTLLATDCYEGLEALRVEIAGGDVTIYPTDDAINASDGSSGGMDNMGGRGMRGGTTGERPDFADSQRPNFAEGEWQTPPDLGEFNGEIPSSRKMGDFSGEQPLFPDSENFDDQRPSPQTTENLDGGNTVDAGECYVRISGGNILIVNENAQDADGIDSNGSVYITGGTILVSLNGNGSNNAIDYGSENGGTAEIHGGTIIACGGATMAEDFSKSSTQPSVSYVGNIAAGSAVALRGANGGTLLEWTVPCVSTYLTLSCPELTLGETYTLSLGDAEEIVTLASVVTRLGNSGSGGFDGFSVGGTTGNFRGGMRRRGADVS